MKNLIIALFVSFSPMLFASESNIPECDICMMYVCSAIGSEEITARFQLGSEPTERLTFEDINNNLYIESYYNSSDDNYLYLVDSGDHAKGFTIRASKSIYDENIGAGEILIQLNGEAIENGEYNCAKMTSSLPTPLE